MASKQGSPIDAVLAAFSGAQRTALEQVRTSIRAALPGATETIAYNIPTFAVDGNNVIGFQGFASHNSLFPYGGQVIVDLAEELAGFPTAKGTIRFALDKPFPSPLLKRIIRRRIELLNETYPKKNGEFEEFYGNGYPKMRGRVRGGVMQGYWEWFRRDGSLMRSGSFKDGAQVGTWTTYDRAGAVVKVSDLS